MAIWVDADACPNVIKEILFRAAERTRDSADAGGEPAAARAAVAFHPHPAG